MSWALVSHIAWAWGGARNAPIMAQVGLVIMIFYAALALLAPLIAPYPETALVGGMFEPWSATFPLGTDQLGRDFLSRLIYGARNMIGLALATTLLAFTTGGFLGLVAAERGGWVDQMLSRIVDVLMAMPQLIFALVLLTAFGSSILNLVLIIAALGATRVFRLARGCPECRLAGVRRGREASAPWRVAHHPVRGAAERDPSARRRTRPAFLLRLPHDQCAVLPWHRDQAADRGLGVDGARNCGVHQLWGCDAAASGGGHRDARDRGELCRRLVSSQSKRAQGMSKTASPLLRIEGLHIEGESNGVWHEIVRGIDLTLDRGEVLGLIGESGAGQFTLGLAAIGYTKPWCGLTAGSIHFDGQDLARTDTRSLRDLWGRRIAYVAQSAAAAFNPAHRLIEQVIEVPDVHRKSQSAAAREDAVTLFRDLQLPDPERIGRRLPHQVSGGQLQRAMTAMAMTCRPDLIIFDESTTALDVSTQIEVMAAIRSVLREFGTAAIYITHDLAVVTQVADRLMVLRHGELVEEAPTVEMIATPRQSYTRSLWAV